MTSFQRLTDINANPLQGGELAIDFRARLNYLRNREAYQVGLIFLDDQQINSFQLLSFTPAISELPALRADESGYLHITWLEQALSGDYLLYYATTEPLAKTELDTITNEDRMRLAEVSLFDLLSGVVLVPFPIFWVTGPLVLTLLTSRLRSDIEPITAPGTLFTIVAGLPVYFYAKRISMPGIISYVPFSVWIPILPESWKELLRIGLPILLGLLGFIVAYQHTFARKNYSPLFFFLIYGLVDGLLTIAIYGVLFYSAI